MAIIQLLDKIITSIDKGDYAAGLFLDFSKAFDTVNHEILLRKLNHYGIRSVANDWLASYLHDRSQYCTLNNKFSTTSNIVCGIPQGSILGQILFLIYINDLGTIFDDLSVFLFADDSNIIATGKSISDIEQKINKNIPILVRWLQTNRLSLNLIKTHTIIFGKKNKHNTNRININIEGTQIDTVQ
jgi:hypothetical protein